MCCFRRAAAGRRFDISVAAKRHGAAPKGEAPILFHPAVTLIISKN
jgi:hypothetical protein